MHEHVTFDYACTGTGKWSIKFGFAVVFAVLVQLIKPRSKLVAWIPVCAQVSGIGGIDTMIGPIRGVV
jgi:hypothetical protein